MMDETYEIKPASELKEGDYLTNIGRVNAPVKLEGVFVLFETYEIEWSPFTGKGVSTTKTHCLHRSTEVTVDCQ